jgi:hypothetical protein
MIEGLLGGLLWAIIEGLLIEGTKYFYNTWIDICLKLAGWKVPFGTTAKKYQSESTFLMGVTLVTGIFFIAIGGWLGILYCIMFYTMVIVVGATIHRCRKEKKERKDESLLDD